MSKFSYQPKIILFKIKIVIESFVEESYTMNFLNQGKKIFFQLNSATDVLNKNQY